jgi:hypothetical protein
MIGWEDFERHSRENGNPDSVPAEAGNHYFRNWIPRIKCGAGPASAGMTNPKNTNLTFRNLKMCGNVWKIVLFLQKWV